MPPDLPRIKTGLPISRKVTTHLPEQTLPNPMNINPANDVPLLPPLVNGLIGHPTGLRTDAMTAKNVGDNVLSSMIDVVVVADMDLTITYANDAAPQVKRLLPSRTRRRIGQYADGGWAGR